MKLFSFSLFMLMSSLGTLSFYSRYNDLMVNKSPLHLSEDTARKPAITLEESAVAPMIVLVIKDTAATTNDISAVLSKSYPELFTFVRQNGLKPGKLMAFYYSSQPPFVMEAGVEIDKMPNQTGGRIKINKVNGGNALIAHYSGPYDQIEIAYTAISNRLKEKNKVAGAPPFEVYLNDPYSVKDPFNLKTDVYQLLQ